MLLRTLSQGTLVVGLDRVGEDQSNRVVPLLRRSLWIGDWEGPSRADVVHRIQVDNKRN